MTEEARGRFVTAGTVPCATCRNNVDPLRAARVAVFGDRFRYFCSAECREGYDPNAGRTPLPVPRRATPRADEITPDEAARIAARRTARALEEVESDALAELSRRPSVAPEEPKPSAPPPPSAADLPAPTDVATLLITIALVAGALSAALLLVGSSPIALTARVVLVLVATGSFVAHAFTTMRDPSELHPVSATAAPAGAAVAALVARITNHPEAGEVVGFAGVLVGSLSILVWLVARARHPIDVERALVAESLAVPGHRIVGDDVVDAPADDLRPGEEIVVEQGEIVPVDATVVAGRATVRPWLSATSSTIRDEGDPVVAGARVLDGRLRAIAGWASNDRAFMRLTHDVRRRADLHAPLARLGHSLAERGAIVAAALAALAAFTSDHDPVWIVVYAVAAHAALANRAVAQIAAMHTAQAVLASLRRGVVFRTADALDQAGRVSTAAFCARGTLLLGEPEVASVETFGAFDPDTVLALVAGTEGTGSRPTAVAIQRAARARGIRPDGVRSPVVQPGLGVTAVAASGQTLVVGSRGLMLRERISVALAEDRITDLEAMGRTVILVALGGRLAGLVGLQDGLRPGARAAVQHLLDVGIEPVLLSGDTRETCEALGRAVDIDHIRPEVLPADRGDEIRRLSDGGAVVAVLGRSPNDDAALSAAEVSVALDAAGSSTAEWSVQLASDDVRDGAYALRLAHGCRADAIRGLLWAAGPGLSGAALMTISLLPVTAPVLLSLLGGAVAVSRLRSRR
ncbi:MAG TPA: HAD family hydrolase [Polyangiaceae bacterium]|nr:HAD family hydrolase [Polyangiaceae bacterium]